MVFQWGITERIPRQQNVTISAVNIAKDGIIREDQSAGPSFSGRRIKWVVYF